MQPVQLFLSHVRATGPGFILFPHSSARRGYTCMRQDGESGAEGAAVVAGEA